MIAGNVDNFWQGAAYFGVGAASGFLGGVAGQAAAAATTLSSGALIGGAGAGASTVMRDGGNALLSGSSFNARNSLISAGVGAVFGGAAGWANGKLQAMEGNQLLANRYRLDVNTGNFDYVDDLGGSGLNFYDVGYYTDGGSAFSLISQEVIEGANAINSFRFWESALATVSAFSAPAAGLTGYFVEPRGPGSSVAGSGQRVPSGSYDLEPHWRTKHGGRYSLQNPSLMGNRDGVLMHYGTSSGWSKGCLLPCSSWGANAAGKVFFDKAGSSDLLNGIQLQIDKGPTTKLNIFNAIR